MRFFKDREEKIREREAEHLKLLGATQISKESEVANSTLYNNPSATKQSFGMTQQDPKTETKFSKVESKVEEKEREKTPFELEIEELGRYWIWENYCDDEFKNKTVE